MEVVVMEAYRLQNSRLVARKRSRGQRPDLRRARMLVCDGIARKSPKRKRTAGSARSLRSNGRRVRFVRWALAAFVHVALAATRHSRRVLL
jgi:hypothetical protein